MARPEHVERAFGRDNYRPQKTATLLAQQIVGELTDHNMEPGSPLPPEHQMIEDYGVARGTLREALRFLEMQNVISIKTGPRGGPVVAAPSPRPLASTIALLLQVTKTPFRAVVEARAVLEPALASMAAERVTDVELEDIRASVERMGKKLDDHEFFIEENRAFHSLVAEAAQNSLLKLLTESLGWICDATPLGVEYPQSVRDTVWKQHRKIYNAIRASDSGRASAAMAAHIRDFERFLDRSYSSVVDEPLRWDRVRW